MLINYSLTQDNIQHQFIDQGFTETKTGAFATVYLNSMENYVYRVFKYDPHYLNYLAFFEHEKSNVFLPNIYELTYYSKPNLYVAKIEKLQPLTHYLNINKAFKMACQYEDILKNWEQEKTKNFNLHFKTLMNGLFNLTKHGKLSDINIENLMMREQQIVFTDPIGY